MAKVLLAKVYVDMDNFKLPDYTYTMDSLMEEGCDFESAKKLLKEKFNTDIVDPMDDREFEEPVSKEDLDKVKVDLLDRLKVMVKDVLDSWVADCDENLMIDDAITECAGKLYTEIEDFGWDATVKIFVEVDGKEEEVKGEGF